MSSRTIARLGGVAGALYFILAFVGNSIGGSADSPAPGSSPTEFARWLADNGPTTVGYVGAFLELIALLAFVVFAAALYDVLRRSERDRTWLPEAVFGAGLVSATIKIASAGPMLAAFSLRHTIDPQLATALIEMNDYAFLLTWAVDAVLLAAAGACALRTGVLPRWLAVSAAVIAPLLLASVAGGNGAPPFAFLLALLWFLAAGVAMARGNRVPARAATLQPAAH
jgi:uncharacterized membrane protein